jgi:hypothetical protein
VPVDIAGAFHDARVVIIANNNLRYRSIAINDLLGTMAGPGMVYDCWSCLEIERMTTPDTITYTRLGSVNAWTV